jgi:glycolate dehydrogenase iron-sulfur subunit
MPNRAFDEIRAPDLDLIADCVHCGFCLETCPTYALWHEEMDSPRGRIVLMKSGLEEGSELSAELVTHIDQCLGCMSCVTACPSGVQYDKLIEDTRAQIERNHVRSRSERVFRRLLFATFTHPGRLRALAPLLTISRWLGLLRFARSNALLERFPRLGTLAGLAPATPLRATQKRIPERTAARGTARARVGLLQGCVQRVFFGPVNEATVQVLAAEGFEVHAPRHPRCCGALQFHSGWDAEGRDLAKQTIAAFDRDDVVAVNAAGCGSAMKDYGHLLRDDPEWSERAAAFSAKVRDVTELLAEHEPVAARQPLPLTLAYHDACHLAHAQAVRSQPRALLHSIPQLELVEPDEWQICCGSAGVYNLLQPQPAAELGRRKAQNLLSTGADAVVAANPGCVLQIAMHSEALGRRLAVYHPMELLRASIEGSGLGGRPSSEGNR